MDAELWVLRAQKPEAYLLELDALPRIGEHVCGERGKVYEVLGVNHMLAVTDGLAIDGTPRNCVHHVRIICRVHNSGRLS